MKKRLQSSPARMPASLPRRDRILFIVCPLLFLVTVGCVLHFTATRRQTKAVTHTVINWKQLYQIKDEAVERIIAIELAFHGSGSPFSSRPYHTTAEQQHHHEEISRFMTPENATRFLKAMETGGGRH